MRKLVLLVEDDEDSLELLKTIVEKEGHDCREARTAAEAIKLCDASNFDLILLDFLLPDAFGIDVARHVQKKGGKVPVIAVSAYLERWDEATYKQLGIRRLIRKPYRLEDIRAALRDE